MIKRKKKKGSSKNEENKKKKDINKIFMLPEITIADLENAEMPKSVMGSFLFSRWEQSSPCQS